MHMAVARGHSDIALLLVRYGAKADQQDLVRVCACARARARVLSARVGVRTRIGLRHAAGPRRGPRRQRSALAPGVGGGPPRRALGAARVSEFRVQYRYPSDDMPPPRVLYGPTQIAARTIAQRGELQSAHATAAPRAR